MFPPILEIYIVWHPNDSAGEEAAEQFVNHFQGNIYSGLLGGAVAVYIRSAAWLASGGAPRPIIFPGKSQDGVAGAQFVVIVPVLGIELARAAQFAGEWQTYLLSMMNERAHWPERVNIYPLQINSCDENSWLAQSFRLFQGIAARDVSASAAMQAPEADLRCRDLAQGIAQWLGESKRLQVFISHTKRIGIGEEDVGGLIQKVREVIDSTRLKAFFDAQDLQPGDNWEKVLHESAATSALLALRTDLYASRTWCQREMLAAKFNGMPIVILDALKTGEARGSFLMDHVARVPIRFAKEEEVIAGIRAGLNLLVDVCLQRILWNKQAEMNSAKTKRPIHWWAPHAPEPVTLCRWLQQQHDQGIQVWAHGLCIIHPDPPLGEDEKAVLTQIAHFAGVQGELDVVTPRILAARGG